MNYIIPGLDCQAMEGSFVPGRKSGGQLLTAAAKRPPSPSKESVSGSRPSVEFRYQLLEAGHRTIVHGLWRVVLKDIQDPGSNSLGHPALTGGLPGPPHLTVHQAREPHLLAEVLASVLLGEVVASRSHGCDDVRRKSFGRYVNPAQDSFGHADNFV